MAVSWGECREVTPGGWRSARLARGHGRSAAAAARRCCGRCLTGAAPAWPGGPAERVQPAGAGWAPKVRWAQRSRTKRPAAAGRSRPPGECSERRARLRARGGSASGAARLRAAYRAAWFRAASRAGCRPLAGPPAGAPPAGAPLGPPARSPHPARRGRPAFALCPVAPALACPAAPLLVRLRRPRLPLRAPPGVAPGWLRRPPWHSPARGFALKRTSLPGTGGGVGTEGVAGCAPGCRGVPTRGPAGRGPLPRALGRTPAHSRQPLYVTRLRGSREPRAPPAPAPRPTRRRRRSPGLSPARVEL